MKSFGMVIDMQYGIVYLIPIVLVTTILMLGCRRLEGKVRLYIIQSLGLALLTLAVGLTAKVNNAYWVAGLTFVGKCILIPYIFTQVIRKVTMKQEVESYVSLPTSMLLGGVLILLSYYLIPSLPFGHLEVLNQVLKAGVAIVLVGLLIMMTRKKAFTQILGLYVLDNGIFCLTIATIFEMPTLIEMGVFFELLLGALVMGIFVYRIKQTFDTVNIVPIKNVRG